MNNGVLRALVGLPTLALSCAAMAADFAPRDESHRKMEFMCRWMQPYDVKYRLTYCEASTLAAASRQELDDSMASFWARWARDRPEYVADVKRLFDRDWLRHEAPPHVYSDAEFQELPIDKLCALVHARGQSANGAARALIGRRLISDRELRSVETKSVFIGMSESALVCALGWPSHRNRTVTAAGESVQWVYRDLIVYTDNGSVTAFQDGGG